MIPYHLNAPARRYVGRTVQVLSIPTVYLGLSAYDARLWVWLVVTVVFFFIICLYLWKQFTQGQVCSPSRRVALVCVCVCVCVLVGVCFSLLSMLFQARGELVLP